MASLEPNQQLSETHNNEHKTDDEPEGTLVGDLEDALSSRFSFEGSFACTTQITRAENACLHIDGVGLIGLPFSERDAKLIMECSVQVPYASSAEAPSNESVCATWEIKPQKVSFQNEDWEKFIHTEAVKTVCDGLGIRTDQMLPRCELAKLFLCGPGSQFLPSQQSTQDTEGVFGTMIVFLPATYTGGQVFVSRGTESKVFDLSQKSIVHTSLLAWYTDVFPEVKPIVSGYRLALSYNLIHVSTALIRLPMPVVSQLDISTQNLREVLIKWKEGVYKTLPKDLFVSCLLEHRYSEQELLAGSTSLKGVDAGKILSLRSIAKELGYTVCLGNLTREDIGDPDGFNMKWKCDKSGLSSLGDSDGADEISMAETYDTKMYISCLVNLDGGRILEDELSAEEECLIPKNPFDDTKPDEKKLQVDDIYREEYQLNCRFRRTVVVLVREEDTLTVLCSNRANGFNYGLNRLKKSNITCPTQLDKEIAYAMIRNIGYRTEKNDNRYNSVNLTDQIPQSSKIMIKCALAWNDVEMWSAIMERVRSIQSLETLGTDPYFEAWGKFSFPKIEHYGIAGAIIKQIVQLQKCLDFIDAIRTHASTVNEPIPDEWFKQKVAEALSTSRTTRSQDLPALLHASVTWGLRLVYENVIIPKSKSRESLDFWLPLIRALIEKKGTLCVLRADHEDKTVGQPQQDVSSNLCPISEFNAILSHCLDIIVPRWNDIPRCHIDADTVQAWSIDCIIQIVDLCILADCLDPCRQLLASILEIDPGAGTDIFPTRFRSLHIPLVPEFINLLKKHNIPLTLPPFDSFLRRLVQLYIQYILGTRQSSAQKVANSQNVGCGKCKDCEKLDGFTADFNQKVIVFRISGPCRSHLEGRLSQLRPKNCDWITLRDQDPHGFQVTKKDDYLASIGWEERRTAAVAFLGSFGDHALLLSLMGPLWDDVEAALQAPAPAPAPAPATVGTGKVLDVHPPNSNFTPVQTLHQHQQHAQAPNNKQQTPIPGPSTYSTQIDNQTSRRKRNRRKRKHPDEPEPGETDPKRQCGPSST